MIQCKHFISRGKNFEEHLHYLVFLIKRTEIQRLDYSRLGINSSTPLSYAYCRVIQPHRDTQPYSATEKVQPTSISNAKNLEEKIYYNEHCDLLEISVYVFPF
jgi:hypothetical protein